MNDTWLLGFSDGEACFSAVILTIKQKQQRARIRYLVSQKFEQNKDVLLIIKDLFNNKGTVYNHYQYDCFTYEIGGLKNCHNIICPYFDSYYSNNHDYLYGFQTKKSISYGRWKTVLLKCIQGRNVYIVVLHTTIYTYPLFYCCV
uniref:LAGLIDADG endonuclease n=1 Tax=Eudorina elegans TaxID=47282 RepID=A0A6M9TT97_9CHLO|nr:LAGLIDADG endonuclease [Eudorina elegans]